MVVGTAKFIWTGVGSLGAAVIVDLGFDSPAAHERLCKVNAHIDTASSAAQAAYHFVMAVKQGEAVTLEAIARGEWAEAWQSLPQRRLCLYGL